MLKNTFSTKRHFVSVSTTFVFFLSVTFFNSCQKNEHGKEVKSQKQKDEEVLKWISEQKTTSFFVPGGKIIESFRTDAEGNRVKVTSPKQQITLATGPGCYVDEPSPVFEGINYREVCDSDPRVYDATVSFKISSDNAIVYRNPNQPTSTSAANQTRGRLQITNSDGSTVLFNEANIFSTIVITDLGVDPSVATNRIYRVTFEVSNIPYSALNTANYVARAYITYYTECEEQSAYPYNLIGAYGNATGLGPCDIINDVWINPSFPSVSGVAACLCCVPPLYSNRQEIEIYNAAGTTRLWHKTITATQTVYIPTSSGGDIGDGYVTPNQTVKIRYRNIQVNTSTNAIECTGGWLLTFKTMVF